MGAKARIASVEDTGHYYGMEDHEVKAAMETKAANAAMVIAGVDVGKANLDASISAGAPRRFGNDPDGRARLLAWLRDSGATQVVCEATGGYERPLVRALHGAEVPVHVAHPLNVRKFAHVSGYEAKTDRIDAQVLARYGETFALMPTPPLEDQTEELRELLARRKQLVDMRTQEYNRRDKGVSKDARKSSERLIKWLDKEIKRLEDKRRAALAKSEKLSERARLYESVPGVGELTATTLAAYLPELGTYTGRQLSSLVGVAPWAKDSGRKKGYRAIRGGRKNVRNALYMAALAAIRWNPDIKRFNERLRERGKHGKVALTAVIRKLLQVLSAIALRGTPWQKSRPATA